MDVCEEVEVVVEADGSDVTLVAAVGSVEELEVELVVYVVLVTTIYVFS